jgi:hypothetical protein
VLQAAIRSAGKRRRARGKRLGVTLWSGSGWDTGARISTMTRILLILRDATVIPRVRGIARVGTRDEV